MKREHWNSKLGFILAAAGSAVGLGNMWKFPYITKIHGGAAFILIYLLFIFLLGLPIMIAEITIGRHTEKDAVGAFKTLAPKKSIWKHTGYISVITAFIILSFYSVVGGWTIGYLFKAISGSINTMSTLESAGKGFGHFISGPWRMIFYHGLFMLSCWLIVRLGITKGIERWSKILMPLLLILLAVVIVKGLTLKNSGRGLLFLLNPDFSKLNMKAVMDALGHAFFTLSLGMGALITYGSYLHPKEKILNAATSIVFLDTLIALMAGFAIFPALYSLSINANLNESAGVLFTVIPVVFSKIGIPIVGFIFSIIFFLLLLIAAITSAISMLEVVVAYFIDEKKWNRHRATLIFSIIIFLIGIPSALSFSTMAKVKIFFGYTCFDFMDKLTTNILLPLGGLLFAIFLGWRYGTDKTIHELDPDTEITAVKKIWAFTLKYISPVLLGVVMFYSMIMSFMEK